MAARVGVQSNSTLILSLGGTIQFDSDYYKYRCCRGQVWRRPVLGEVSTNSILHDSHWDSTTETKLEEEEEEDGKKRKRKPRPSFDHLTLHRWSLPLSSQSQRSTLPWQTDAPPHSPNTNFFANYPNFSSRNSEDENKTKTACSNPSAELALPSLSLALPWETERKRAQNQIHLHAKSNTELADSTIPELELKRLRDAALRMKERFKVGPAGITQTLVQAIRDKWKHGEIVKLRFEGPPSLDMKATHQLLEVH